MSRQSSVVSRQRAKNRIINVKIVPRESFTVLKMKETEADRQVCFFLLYFLTLMLSCFVPFEREKYQFCRDCDRVLSTVDRLC